MVQEKVLLMTECRLQKLKIDLTGVLPLSFLYRLFERMCEVAPAKFDAGESGYKSSAAFLVIRLQQ